MKLNSNEKLTRFLFSKNNYSFKYKRVKLGSFMPPPNSTSLSMCHITGVEEREIWTMCEKDIEPIRKKTAKARADIAVSDILVASRKLSCILDRIGYKNHVSVNGWPTEKDMRQVIAQDLAVRSELKIRSKDEL